MQIENLSLFLAIDETNYLYAARVAELIDPARFRQRLQNRGWAIESKFAGTTDRARNVNLRDPTLQGDDNIAVRELRAIERDQFLPQLWNSFSGSVDFANLRQT